MELSDEVFWALVEWAGHVEGVPPEIKDAIDFADGVAHGTRGEGERFASPVFLDRTVGQWTRPRIESALEILTAAGVVAVEVRSISLRLVWFREGMLA